MAQIRLDDDVYERLKAVAEDDCRTVGEEIHYLLDHRVELTAIFEIIQGVPEKKESKTLVEVSDEVRNTSKADEIQELLAKRRSVVDSLDEKNLVSWVQKKAVEEFWSDEQAKYEGDLHRQELESERDLITDKLHALGV